MDNTPSLIVGVNKPGSYSLTDGQRNVLLVAPTGAGKGVAVVIPNLLHWTDSAIVHDIKMENFELSSGWRAKQGQKIYLFAPLSSSRKTHRYNPLDHISSDSDKIVDDIQKIAYLLIGGNCTVSSDARNLLTAIILHLTSDPKRTRSFGEVVRILLGDFNKELSKTNSKIHSIGKALISSFLEHSDCKKSCAVSMLLTKLELWTNPFIDDATSTSDFNVADFKKHKSTLYIGLDSNDITRLAPLMQLFYQHFAQMLSTPVIDAKKEPNRVLFIMDDFPSIGKMDMFLTNLPYFRGYHICALLIAKSIEHIKNCYGDLATDIITSDFNYKITYTARTYSTAEYFSKISNLSSEEFINLDQDEQVLLVDGEKPIRSKKLRYFDDKNFDGKILKPAKI